MLLHTDPELPSSGAASLAGRSAPGHHALSADLFRPPQERRRAGGALARCRADRRSDRARHAVQAGGGRRDRRRRRGSLPRERGPQLPAAARSPRRAAPLPQPRSDHMLKPSALAAQLEALIRTPGPRPAQRGGGVPRVAPGRRAAASASWRRRCARAAFWWCSTTSAPGTRTSIASRCSVPTSSRSTAASSPASTATSTSRRRSRAWSASRAASARWWSPRGSRPRPRR